MEMRQKSYGSLVDFMLWCIEVNFELNMVSELCYI